MRCRLLTQKSIDVPSASGEGESIWAAPLWRLFRLRWLLRLTSFLNLFICNYEVANAPLGSVRCHHLDKRLHQEEQANVSQGNNKCDKYRGMIYCSWAAIKHRKRQRLIRVITLISVSVGFFSLQQNPVGFCEVNVRLYCANVDTAFVNPNFAFI